MQLSTPQASSAGNSAPPDGTKSASQKSEPPPPSGSKASAKPSEQSKSEQLDGEDCFGDDVYVSAPQPANKHKAAAVTQADQSSPNPQELSEDSLSWAARQTGRDGEAEVSSAKKAGKVRCLLWWHSGTGYRLREVCLLLKIAVSCQ